jgi:hypothetical protein
MSISELSDHLKDHVFTLKSHEQKEIISANWGRIRGLIAQNAGFGEWGPHLKEKDLEVLKKNADDTVQVVDCHDITKIFNRAVKDLPGINYLFFNQIDKAHYNFKNAEAIFLKLNKEFSLRHCQYILDALKQLVTDEGWQKRDPIVSELLVGNLIAFLPFFGLDQLKEVELPRRIDGKWRLVSYTIEKIPLSGDNKAFGLVAKEDVAARPILIFRGTPYPALPGFLDAVLSDTHPLKDVGQDLFENGKSNLDVWMKGKEKVDCCGISLGGALAYHAANAYGDRIYLNCAIAAPGITSRNGGKIYGRAFYNDYDFVKYIGYLPESQNLETYFVLFEKAWNPISAHARPLGLEPLVLLKVNPTYENKTWARYFANMFKRVGSVFASIFLIPLKYILILVNKIKSLWNKGSSLLTSP